MRIRSGEQHGGRILKGSIKGFCPDCNMELPLQLLVTATNIDSQKVVNQCSKCGLNVIGYTRNNHGEITHRYIHPKLKKALTAYKGNIVEYLKRHGKPLDAVEEESDMITAADLLG